MSDLALEIEIPASLHGKRLDFALSELGELSRSRIQQLLKDNCIEGPADVLKPSAKVLAGMHFCIRVPATEPLDLTPEDIPLDILFEDEHLLVINKPAGLVVHPSHGHATGTLVHALLHHCPNLPGINGVERPGIVHRLDKDTSGSIVIAKSETAHQRLVAMFAEHDLDRQYLAWCRGAPNWASKSIELPIGRHPAHRKKMAVNPAGKHAITEARVERNYHQFCRMRLTLHTGRTHQIRVHLAHEQLPILGDTVYARSYSPGNEVPVAVREVISSLHRQALHAEVLHFTHPITGEELNCIAPLPSELKMLSETMENAYA